jgi:hypothetical protein
LSITVAVCNRSPGNLFKFAPKFDRSTLADHNHAAGQVKNFTNFSCDADDNLIIIRTGTVSETESCHF